MNYNVVSGLCDLEDYGGERSKVDLYRTSEHAQLRPLIFTLRADSNKPFYLFFFNGKDKANDRAGHLMVSDHRRPRPRAAPEELQVRCLPVRWVGLRNPALPDAKRSGIKSLLHAGFKCRGW